MNYKIVKNLHNDEDGVEYTDYYVKRKSKYGFWYYTFSESYDDGSDYYYDDTVPNYIIIPIIGFVISLGASFLISDYFNLEFGFIIFIFIFTNLLFLLFVYYKRAFTFKFKDMKSVLKYIKFKEKRNAIKRYNRFEEDIEIIVEIK